MSARRLDIQGLRALSVIAVVAYHADLAIPGGFVGVDVFFVISGFVITAMLLREKASTGKIRLGRFYSRRFRRLTPALAVMVTVTIIGSAFLLSPLGVQQNVAITAIGALGLFANFAIGRTSGGYFDIAASHNPLLHTWTLSLEEQFYLIFPFILLLGWFAARRLNRGDAVVIIVAIFGLLSLAIALATSFGLVIPRLPPDLLGFYGPVGRAWEFAAGAILALLSGRLKVPSVLMATVASTIGLVLLAVSMFFLSGENVFPGLTTLIPVSGALLLLYGGFNTTSALTRALSRREFVYVGDLSYSWYLWHWPIIVFAVALIPDAPWVPAAAALASFLPAMASYRWVEQPMRQFSVTRRRLSLVVIATISVPVVFAGALGISAANGYWSPRLQSFQASHVTHAGYAAGCMSFVAITAETKDGCTWNAQSDGDPIYLVGDSIAEHYSEGLIAASEEMDRPLTIATSPGCPVFHVRVMVDRKAGVVDFTKMAACTPYITGTVDWLEKQPAGDVVIGENDVVWWSPTDVIPSNYGPDVAQARKAKALEDGLTATVERLTAAGHHVTLAKAPPSYRFPKPSWDVSACTTPDITSGSCFATRSIDFLDELQGPMRKVIENVANSTGSSTIDFRDYLCSDGVCSTDKDGTPMYLDDIHLSVDASLQLAPLFVDQLRSTSAKVEAGETD